MDRFPSLTVHDARGVCWVSIDRQGDRNSLDRQTIDELCEQLADAERSGARAMVYQGAGEAYFIGGADGVEMYELDSDGAHAFSLHIQDLFNRMEQSPLLLVAAIDGHCFGGGLEFALACDLRVATGRSRLGLPEVRLGIIPGGGGTQRLPRVVGFGRAVEMVLEGRLHSADKALEAGLVHAVVPPSELVTWAEDKVRRVISSPAFALAAAKRALYAGRTLPLDEGLGVEADAFAGCFSERYFADCVGEQLRDGRLVTTRDTATERKAGRRADV